MDRYDHLAPDVVLNPMPRYCLIVPDSEQPEGDGDGHGTELRGGGTTRWEARCLRHVRVAGSEVIHAPR
jgi:hypothetical protein